MGNWNNNCRKFFFFIKKHYFILNRSNLDFSLQMVLINLIEKGWPEIWTWHHPLPNTHYILGHKCISALTMGKHSSLEMTKSEMTWALEPWIDTEPFLNPWWGSSGFKIRNTKICFKLWQVSIEMTISRLSLLKEIFYLRKRFSPILFDFSLKYLEGKFL